MTVAAATTPRRAESAVGEHRWNGVALSVVSLGLAALSLLGPLVTGAIDYRISDDVILSQLLGLDAVSLAIVAPLAAVAAALALRASPVWPLLAMGPALYVAYMVPQYVLGPDYVNREGNNEAFFPLFLVLLVLALGIAISAWRAMDFNRIATSARAERLLARVLLPVAACLVFSRYVPLLADTMSPEPSNAEYLAGPTFLWTITLLDLGFALPATVAAIVGFRRGASWAHRALYSMVGWFSLVGLAVAAMAIAMYARDDPGSSLRAAIFMALLGLALTAIAVGLGGPILAAHRRADARPAS
jgi:ABC-type multidrug transport system fused ATPase/permease subunit